MIRPLLSALALALAFAAPAQAQVPGKAAGAAQGLELSGGWTRPALKGGTAAGYFTARNAGRAPLTIVGADTPVAERAQFHQSETSGGVMRMRHEPGVTLGPGQSIAFQPGGRHLMIMGLNRPLKAGETVTVTLRMAGGGSARLDLAVGAGPAPADHSRHH